jgi:hypothetical protein
MRNQQNTGTRSHRITDMYEPKKKTDYEYRGILSHTCRMCHAHDHLPAHLCFETQFAKIIFLECLIFVQAR